MNESRLETIEQIPEFLAGTSDVAFTILSEESKVRLEFLSLTCRSAASVLPSIRATSLPGMTKAWS